MWVYTIYPDLSFWILRISVVEHELSHLITKPTNWHVRPAKTQVSLGIRPVWSESLLSAWRKLGSLATHRAHSEDSDQTGRMPRLIWVLAGRTVIILLVLSWGCSVYVAVIQIQNIVESLQTFVMLVEDPENSLQRPLTYQLCQHMTPQPLCKKLQPDYTIPCPSSEDIKYRMTRASVDCINIFVVEGGTAMNLQVFKFLVWFLLWILSQIFIHQCCF